MPGFIKNVIRKSPTANLTYGMSWRDWLIGGNSIATATWVVPVGITKVSNTINTVIIIDADGVSHPIGTVALVTLSGGTPGKSYTLSCSITSLTTDSDIRRIVVICDNTR